MVTSISLRLYFLLKCSPSGMKPELTVTLADSMANRMCMMVLWYTDGDWIYYDFLYNVYIYTFFLHILTNNVEIANF